MKLIVKEILNREICHYADSNLNVTSNYNRVFVKKSNEEFQIQLENDGLFAPFGFSRIARRALRLDKCNVISAGNDFVIIRRGNVYHYDTESKELTQTLKMSNCRNVLHQSWSVINKNEIIFGEYGRNSGRIEIPVYKSFDGGKSWEKIFVFPIGKAKHVHGCHWDSFEEKVWVFTGDFDGECHVICADKNFENVEWIGDGTQTFRACTAFFEEDAVHWIMDSHIQDSHHVVLNRKTRTAEKRERFQGPVWYTKRLSDGYYLATTAQETGGGVRDNFAHLMVSKDLETWEDIHSFEHDGLPKGYFKFGVIGFADGEQSSDSFYIHCEAIKGFDGKTAICSLEA